MSAVSTLARAALSAALLVSALGAVPSPSEGLRRLPSGAEAYVQPDTDQPVAAVALWFRAPSGGFDATPVPGISRLAATAIAASMPITGTTFSALVAQEGGVLSVSAFPDTISVTAVVPPQDAAATLRALTTAYFAPVLTDAGIQATRTDAVESALVRSFEPEDAVEDALDAQLFASGPFHGGRSGYAPALQGVTAAALRAFAERAFAPANAIVVASGNVADDVLGAVSARSGGAPGVAETPPPVPAPAVAVPGVAAAPSPAANASANVDADGLGWTGPPITDESAATAMDFLAATLFAPEGAVTRALAGHAASASGRYVTYHDPGVFLVTITGRDADAVRPLVAAAIAAAATPMDRGTFEAARGRFVYGVLQDATTASGVADTAGWYALEGDPGYAPSANDSQGRYVTIARGLTPRTVAAAAAKYLTVAPAAVLLHHTAPAPARKAAV